jgi:hypothetical protein
MPFDLPITLVLMFNTRHQRQSRQGSEHFVTLRAQIQGLRTSDSEPCRSHAGSGSGPPPPPYWSVERVPCCRNHMVLHQEALTECLIKDGEGERGEPCSKTRSKAADSRASLFREESRRKVGQTWRACHRVDTVPYLPQWSSVLERRQVSSFLRRWRFITFA